MTVRHIFIALTAVALSFVTASGVYANENTETNETKSIDTDSTDSEIRVNPTLGDDKTSNTASQHYPFIKYNANHINLNGADWSNLRNALDNLDKSHGTLNIVHIGDSHVQAEGNTSRVRRFLQNKYGNAGRGLIIPFRLAGTNQPTDYHITSPSSFSTAKLMRIPWTTTMGFTGISLSIPTSSATFNISNQQPFDKIIVYGRNEISISDISVNGNRIDFDTTDGSDTATATLSSPTTACSITVNAPSGNIYGFELQSTNSGIRYHAIGNNGATFAQYNAIGKIGYALKRLSPDLVIISLGTNEAFGKTSNEALTRQIDILINDIRIHNPNVQILLTTPSECQRSVYTTKRYRRRRGRRARTRRVRSYAVNTNIARLRSAILSYGEQHHIATWDWYNIAGGDGSSSKWLAAHLLGNDRIHRTWTGYHLEGDLLATALDAAITGNIHVTKNIETKQDSPTTVKTDDTKSVKQTKATKSSTKKKQTTKKKSKTTKKRRNRRRR